MGHLIQERKVEQVEERKKEEEEQFSFNIFVR